MALMAVTPRRGIPARTCKPVERERQRQRPFIEPVAAPTAGAPHRGRCCPSCSADQCAHLRRSEADTAQRKHTDAEHCPTVPVATAAAPANGFAIAGCYNRLVPPAARPMKLNILGCASVAVALQDMSWSSWGPQGADGSGIAVFKICEPNCAKGYQLTNQVAVHAWNPQPPRNDSGCPAGLKIFADMILAFPKGVPPATAQKMNTQYNGMPAVHYVELFRRRPRGRRIHRLHLMLLDLATETSSSDIPSQLFVCAAGYFGYLSN